MKFYVVKLFPLFINCLLIITRERVDQSLPAVFLASASLSSTFFQLTTCQMFLRKSGLALL